MAIVQSIFGDIATSESLQAIIDATQVEMFGATSFRNYLGYGVPQIQLTFEQVIGRARVGAAASVVDEDSPAPLRSRAHLEVLTGKIPTMKEKFSMSAKDYRDLMQIRSMLSGVELDDELVRILQNDIREVGLSVDYRMEYMFLEGISNLSISLSTLNNPDGVAFGTVPLIPDATERAKHLKTVATVWTDAAADPIQDIRTLVREVAEATGRTFAQMWMTQDKLWQLMNNKAVKEYISGLTSEGALNRFIVTEDALQQFLRGNRLPEIRVVSSLIGIESIATEADKASPIKYKQPFKSTNIAFVPAGKLGTIQNAISVEDRERVPGKQYAKYERALLKKWRDDDPWREYTEVEAHLFPALDAIDSIYLLQTDVATE